MDKSKNKMFQLIQSAWKDLYDKTRAPQIVFTTEEDVRCHFFRILWEYIQGKSYVVLFEQRVKFDRGKGSHPIDLILIDYKAQKTILIELKATDYGSNTGSELENQLNYDFEILNQIYKKVPGAALGVLLGVDLYFKRADPALSEPIFEEISTNKTFPIYQSIFGCCTPRCCADHQCCKNESCTDSFGVGYDLLAWYFSRL